MSAQELLQESPALVTASQRSQLQELFEQQAGPEGDQQQQQVMTQRRAFGVALAAALPSAVACNNLEVGEHVSTGCLCCGQRGQALKELAVTAMALAVCASVWRPQGMSVLHE